MSENATPATEFAPCHHLTQPCQCDLQKTRHRTRLKWLRLPRKMTMDASKVAAPATKTATHLLKTSQKYCACHANRNDYFDTLQNTSECHEVPRLPRETKQNQTSETSKKDHLCKTSHRHGHTVLTRTVADGCERLRTVATTNATSSEHTLNPQTPRVKREPLLRIREQNVAKDFHGIFTRDRMVQ